jgi:hypothetical protein
MSYRARAYPYPVLSSFSNDFGGNAKFTAEVELSIPADDIQRVVLNYSVAHSSAWLDEYLLDDHARLVLDIECRATLIREYVTLEALSGSIPFESGQLYGVVTVTPLIIASEDNDEYQPEGIDAEFGNAKFTVRNGDILGVGDSTSFDLEFARTLERDLIKFQYSTDAVEADAYRFELTGQRIIIVASESLRDAVGHMRANPSTKPYLYMSIYKDCIAAALDYLATDGGGEDTELPWGRALLRKLDEIDRTLVGDGPEYRQISAQLLVGSRGIKKVEAAVA